MKNLANIIENLIINESFQSSTLRELMQVINKTALKNNGEEILPRGIAWDKIPENLVFYGESLDPQFIKKFVNNDNYIIIWYPLITKTVASTRRINYNVKINDVFFSCGKQLIAYNNKKFDWRNSTAQNGIVARVGNKTIDKSETYTPSVREYNGPLGGRLTVKKLAEESISSCIAISKDTIVEYSTLDLINSRIEARTGATALMRNAVSDQDVLARRAKRRRDSWSSSYNMGMIDYDIVRNQNQERYKKFIRETSGKNVAGRLLSKYANDLETIKNCIDKYSRIDIDVPEYIKDLIKDNDKFEDIYFKCIYPHELYSKIDGIKKLQELQKIYDEIIVNLNYVIKCIMVDKKGIDDWDVSNKIDNIKNRFYRGLELVKNLS